MRGPLAEELDIFQRWFDKVYPQWSLKIHYRWRDKEHQYHLVIKHHGSERVLPLHVPEAWFAVPEMEKALREAVVTRLQSKAIQEIG